jgi:hypothetical protein
MGAEHWGAAFRSGQDNSLRCTRVAELWQECTIRETHI